MIYDPFKIELPAEKKKEPEKPSEAFEVSMMLRMGCSEEEIREHLKKRRLDGTLPR